LRDPTDHDHTPFDIVAGLFFVIDGFLDVSLFVSSRLFLFSSLRKTHSSLFSPYPSSLPFRRSPSHPQENPVNPKTQTQPPQPPNPNDPILSSPPPLENHPKTTPLTSLPSRPLDLVTDPSTSPTQPISFLLRSFLDQLISTPSSLEGLLGI